MQWLTPNYFSNYIYSSHFISFLGFDVLPQLKYTRKFLNPINKVYH